MACILISYHVFAQDTEIQHKSSIYEAINQESESISKTSDHEKLADLHLSRGESYLILGMDQEALEDFQMGYQYAQYTHPKNQIELTFRSMMGAFLVFVRAENLSAAETLGTDLLGILKSYDCDQCPSTLRNFSSTSKVTSFIHLTSNRPDWPILGPDQIPMHDCLERVETTKDALIILITAIKKTEVRFLAMSVINALADQATNCCYKGGVWKGCLQPLVNKLHYWKLLGIPADPAWDE
jgi:hypothetical protein